MSSLRKYSNNRGAEFFNGRWHSALRGTPVYESWRGMKKRCLCPNHDAYHNYGGRGIKICAGLLDSPMAILDAIGDRPKGKTLDRINNDKHYTCGVCVDCVQNRWETNIRWSTPKQQARNSRVNRIVTIDGVSKPACEWAEQLGIPYALFMQRLYAGFPKEMLIGPRLRNRRKK